MYLSNEYWAQYGYGTDTKTKWLIYPIAGGKLIIKSMRDKLNLQVMLDGACKVENDNELLWEWFSIEKGDNCFFIYSHHTKRILERNYFGKPNTSNLNKGHWQAVHIYVKN